MSDPTTPAPTTPPAPKLFDSPWVKEVIRLALAVALAWLAGKGIRLPAEQQTTPPVVVVNTAPAHDAR